MSSAPPDRRAAAAAGLLRRVFASLEAPLAFRLWDGTTTCVGTTGESGCAVVFRSRGAFRRIVRRPTSLRFGEAYIDGELDIGCGWGSLVIWAAERYGVLARGVTLSRAQAEYGQAWIRRLGLEERARVDHLDYRDLPRELRFDKIAAVGVIEHLGIGNYPDYFARVHELLAPGGLFLNHGITHEKHWRRSSQTEFLERHVFPNGEMDNVSHILDVLERARFEIRDVESLREHYARTTRQWAERLQANAARARALAGERIYRTWIGYLAASSVSFTQGSTGLYQVVASRADPAVREAVPTTREAIYSVAAPAEKRKLARAS